MAEEQKTETAPEETAEETEERPAGRARKTHGERAVANLRTAKRSQREVSDDDERVQFLLAEANVLALLDLADAIRGQSSTNGD